MSPRRLLAVVLLPTLAACSWWMAGRPSGEVAEPVRFDHPLHVDDFGMACAECHGDVALATSLEAGFLPAETLCLDCHERDTDCVLCHTDPAAVRPRLAAAGPVPFSHARHSALEGADCSTCHGAVLTAAAGEHTPGPGHETCFGCHEHAQAYEEANCQPCHSDMRVLPLTAVAEFEHSGDWLGRHGLMAESAGAACLQCHTQASCAECHSSVTPGLAARLWPERVGESLVHRGDFLHSHALEARADADLCLRCHQTSACEDCHAASGLTLTSIDPLRVHPRGWNRPGAPDFHGPAARSDIVACASCHDQGPSSNCVECHRVGGIGGNPHPSSFAREDTGQTMCRVCHAP